MRSLALVAEHGSLQAAAGRCGLSPAAVHQHLKKLEAELQTRLYANRDGRLTLTEPGDLMLRFVSEILTQHEAALMTVRGWKDASRGLVRVGAGPSFSSSLLPTLVRRFRRRHPGVEVFVETGSSGHLLERLRMGALDLVFDIAASALDDTAYKQVALWRSQAAFIGRRASFPARCSLKRIEKEPFILFQKGSRMDTIVQGYLDQLNFRPKVAMRSDSAEAIKAMIRAGLGISVLFVWNINTELRSNVLTVLRTEAAPLELRMALIRSRCAYESQAVQEFVRLARQMNWQNLHPE